MNSIQYTCVFRGVVLVRVPVARPKAEIAPQEPVTPAVKPVAPAARPAPSSRLLSVA